MDSRRLGTPTREAAEVLITDLETRIETYEALETETEGEHAMSKQFLDTEHAMLRAVLNEVKKTVKTMPYAVQTATKKSQQKKREQEEEEEEETEDDEL
jgi:hypothetical protein